MASRSLTESFTFMRNNAFQNRSFFADQLGDREALVSKSKHDVGTTAATTRGRSDTFPPEWQKLVNSVQYTFSVIRQKMKELIALHDRHLMATNLDDNLDEDQEIEHQTKELTEIFGLSHRQLSQLSSLRRSSSVWHGSHLQKLSENVLSNLARSLQELSMAFRKSQSEYLNKLKSRDDRISGYLSLSPMLDSTNSGALDEFGDSEYQLWEAQKQKRNALLEDNTTMVVQREQEINEIVRSIHELNEIFRDVAQLVVDQEPRALEDDSLLSDCHLLMLFSNRRSDGSLSVNTNTPKFGKPENTLLVRDS
ncbi:SNARE domain protein [Paragonimus heterotremus]|uniref:SNARE domain protein n=1 Tax=Paragonimus heterotremus TaxID=100268 RepID=A0A8J4WI03_9TREM|nr:SNARE domain protein [Paragonimus heterotremus]